MLWLNKKKVGIIGFGNMGSAIAERIKKKYKVFVFDKYSSKTDTLSGIDKAESVSDLVNKSEVVILAVKPQDFDNLLGEIKGAIKDKLLISIAAGISTGHIEKILDKARVVRVMPNLPARIGRGINCICKGFSAEEKDLEAALAIFKFLGTVFMFNEEMMDEATAISGSGPGYFYDLVEGKTLEEIKNYSRTFATSLTASAVDIGFTEEKAKMLAEDTANGSVAFLEKTKLSPSEAKKQVVSKGGTTEAGLEVLHKNGSLQDAVKAALKRAKELSSLINH